MKRSINQLILGSLLGDMGIYYGDKSSKYPRITVSHSEKQKEYVMLKYDILKEYVLTPPQHKPNKGFSKDSIKVIFSTQSLPVFKKYHDMCYPDGPKKITRKWLDNLTEEGLAYWYMDDGGLTGSRKNLGISTHSFSYEEHEIIQKYFLDKWDITVSIKKHKNIYWMIYANATNRNKFCSIIKPYIINSMMYKILITEIDGDCIICGKHYKTVIKSKTCDSSTCIIEYKKKYFAEYHVNIRKKKLSC